MRHLVVCCTIVGVLVGCSPSSQPGTGTGDAMASASAIQAIARSFAEAAKARDVNQIAPSFSKNPDFTWAGDGQLMLVSSDTLMSYYRAAYRAYRSMDFVWDTMQVAMLSPDVGVLSGAAHFTVTDTSGQTVKQGAAVTYVFVREDGQWKLRQGHASHRILSN